MLVIPVYNRIILPDSEIYFQSAEFRELAGRGFSLGENVVLAVTREKQQRDQLTADSFCPVGVSGSIAEISRQGYVMIRTAQRVNISEVFVSADHSVDLTMTLRPDTDVESTQDSTSRMDSLKEEILKMSDRFQGGEWLKSVLNSIHSLGTLACFVSPWLSVSNEDRYQLLEEDSAQKRAEGVEKMLYGFLEVAKVTGEASASQKKQVQDAYREQAIKKQMEYLQKEIDGMHPENLTDIQRLEKKIEESGMNADARREADKVLNRLKQEGQQSPESGMLYDYLDFLTSLSWKKEDMKHIDLSEARRILDEDHYGLKKVKARIIQQLAVMNLKHQQQGSILLFVGAPGTGKTSIGRSIAKALGRKYVRVSLGGVRDEADIRGHRRTYIGAMPGRIMDGIAKSGVSNPVMVLDEVDKLSSSYNGDPAGALLEVLDPEQNSTFTDHYMNVPYDLSNVMFICTANTTDTIPEPLLNRMEVIRFTGYTPDEKLQIAKKHLLPKSEEAMGIPAGRLEIPDETLRVMISDYTMEAGVRGLRQRIDTLCREVAVKIADGAEAGDKAADAAPGTDNRTADADEDSAIVIRPEQLREELDLRPVHHDRILEKTKPGVVTGLAWTQVGGEILYIESLFTKGNGKLIITGQLGDVMKESAQIAVSLVKSLFPEKAGDFSENDLHIHVPEGAVPKDGPSAGVTLTTAIASLVAGHAVSPDVAMTGEVSLRGAVTAIGGLPEKLMAAQRAGVKKVFIPKDNVEDLRDVAPEVRDALTIIPVSDVTEILQNLGILEEQKLAETA